MTDPASGCLLDDLGVLHISGADARKFLQGQLSNDMEQLRTERLLRAGLHNAQGRTLAVLALLTAADDSILAVLPRELLGTVSSLLKRYVLRSKVTLSDASEHYRIYGLTSRPDEAIADGGLLVRYGAGDDERLLLLLPAGASPLPSSIMRERWRALDIAAGLPQVCGATSGHFVAQMLNLDCIDAVSFDKGCYTGQEIIARAHYRGRVKRRMQRFVTDGAPRPDVAPQSGLPVGLQAGDTGRLHDGRHYEIVDAARLGDGRYEFLAVAHLPGATADPATTDPDGAEAAPAAAAPTGALRLVAQPQPLPYQLP